ncbi:MAG TPA: endopeptidase La [Candidatus Deferrimicrobiaceae bacterium]|nr:endopeptidase La [Candidatus Deferrimicrobiaceae bacterium]
MEERKKILPLLPLRDIVVFPGMVVPLFVGRDKSVAALEAALSFDRMIFLSSQIDPSTNEPEEDEIHRVGTISHVIQMLKLPDGTVKVLVEGRLRAKIVHYLPNDRYFQVSVEESIPVAFTGPSAEAMIRNVHASFENFSKLSKKIPQDLVTQVSGIDDTARLADTLAAQLPVKVSEKQAVLELETDAERLEKLLLMMESEVEVLEIERRIRGRVKKQMEKSQREFYLNEQMRAIQKELGQGEEGRTELDELEEKIRKRGMGKEALHKAQKEIKKLRMMSPMSAEATVSRNYIDWLVSIPWQERTEDKLDISEAERVLDEDHYGLEKVKERILEYLAVRKLVSKLKGPILCFVGPPGVGKTSLARSIARAMGRKFVRMSLGGVRDEAEIRGHRRTYIGAMPGKIMQQVKKAGTVNPVFLLDEVDKMSADFRGDPSSALLEVLDPEQNSTFNDHYLDVDYDLSDVFFVTTANMLHGIPGPLQDRMEIIRLLGYTEVEKLHIARGYLIPKKVGEHGLSKEKVTFSDMAILQIIRYYTREAGVRSLEREIASVCRKIARQVVKNPSKDRIMVTPKAVRRYLGVTRYRYGEAEEKQSIGVATGLAWTEVGGELLLIEVAIMPGKGNVKVTGKLGEVMQESASAALSCIRTRAELMGIEKEFYQKNDIHIHVPEGATPKDGPSAGITMATALASALLRVPARNDLAMTGEITLRGRVLPIGGVKEKLLAAHRGGIKTVILPLENEKDLAEVPAKIKNSLEIHFVRHMDEVMALAIDLPKERKAPPAEDGTPPSVPPHGGAPEGDVVTH